MSKKPAKESGKNGMDTNPSLLIGPTTKKNGIVKSLLENAPGHIGMDRDGSLRTGPPGLLHFRHSMELVKRSFIGHK